MYAPVLNIDVHQYHRNWFGKKASYLPMLFCELLWRPSPVPPLVSFWLRTKIELLNPSRRNWSDVSRRSILGTSNSSEKSDRKSSLTFQVISLLFHGFLFFCQLFNSLLQYHDTIQNRRFYDSMIS